MNVPNTNGYLFLSQKRQMLNTLYNSNVGKGDDTIKELNRVTSIVIDPSLVKDPSFWDYCIVPNEQAPMRLHILGKNCGKDAGDVLVNCGADLNDVEFYEESYGIFDQKVTLGAPTSVAGLVVLKKNFYDMDDSDIDMFAKTIVVRGGYGDYEEEEDEEEEDSNSDGNGGNPRRIADIEVSSLGELRALTICSYAYLTKKS